MKRVLVLYATREGHTRRIAERVADTLVARGYNAHLVDARQVPNGLSLQNYAAAIIAASVHRETHEREIVNFAKRRADQLTAMPTLFLSVSLSAAGAADHTASPQRRAAAAADVQRMIDGFVAQTGWRPLKSVGIAGALRYSRYNLLLRFVMKRVAASQGASTDTSRDHVFTNWEALDRLVEEFIPAVIPARATPV